ncbi:phenylacetate-CoA oxygenase subunit PaaJ [Nocardioides sp. dk4132]|uniref:1,2-phenylacetyl-CoA epoxidase subunit PaaD n=1 Tax=unclassified Nocardioides TaxID=2615069 RepID=UPI001297CDBD|nr:MULTISPECIES: 1,2-phenylacetyl-CoA epoxidase subunit PaaD [unclassified Nocardioides]MQW74313.1 phenylacetate-CoA oxygenase subunit PaaJ [Nocardioides sp. dk4132]QGA09505.1 phenylacetate-CoA oxygenase subunit PaaJ [Nocardioides sp. dk884]
MRTAWEVAADVVDPELPMITLADLGVLRSVVESGDGMDRQVTVTLTPTYSGCPATATMRDDLEHALRAAGWARVRVCLQLAPPWSTNDITTTGRAALVAAGVSPPGPAPSRTAAVPLLLAPTRYAARCPRCGSERVELLSRFGPTACTAILRCSDCAEPFEHVKEV